MIELKNHRIALPAVNAGVSFEVVVSISCIFGSSDTLITLISFFVGFFIILVMLFVIEHGYL